MTEAPPVTAPSHACVDAPPFTMPADFIEADVGIDHLELLDGLVPWAPTTWGRIKALFR